MLRFFRNFRKQVLGEGRFIRYLIYAGGEILLVVVGILLVSHINNWNLQKIKRKEELKLTGILSIN